MCELCVIRLRGCAATADSLRGLPAEARASEAARAKTDGEGGTRARKPRREAPKVECLRRPEAPRASRRRVSGAEGGTRTPTTLRPQAPEACASANSATSAGIPAVAPSARRRGVERQSIPDGPSVPRAPAPATGRARYVTNVSNVRKQWARRSRLCRIQEPRPYWLYWPVPPRRLLRLHVQARSGGDRPPHAGRRPGGVLLRRPRRHSARGPRDVALARDCRARGLCRPTSVAHDLDPREHGRRRRDRPRVSCDRG